METTKQRSDQVTITIPKKKKGLRDALRRMKEEDAVNLSAWGVQAFEEKLGHFPYYNR